MPRNRSEEIYAVIREARSLIHRVVAVVNELHETEDITASMRGVMEGLASGRPQTVPQMARARPVTRQHIQSIVNGLLDRGLVELAENPAHKRSSLVRLTAKGRQAFARLQGRERPIFRQMRLDASNRDLETTIETLKEIRRYFESQEWRRLLIL